MPCPAPLQPNPGPEPAPGPDAPPSLGDCFASAGISFVDGSDPVALVKAGKVWNKLNDTVPVAVAYPTSTDQVAAAVKCTRAAGVQAVARWALPPAPPHACHQHAGHVCQHACLFAWQGGREDWDKSGVPTCFQALPAAPAVAPLLCPALSLHAGLAGTPTRATASSPAPSLSTSSS
jgi:hypothetical protein